MPIKVLMPALSPTMTEGKLASWKKKEGDAVKSGDVLAEIETDKATMEVEAVDEGTLGKILVAAGTEGVKVNHPIALILEEGEDKSALAAAANGGPETRGRLPDEIRIVERNAGRAAAQRERSRTRHAQQRVVHVDRLKHRAELVIAVGARAQHAQIEVDLGIGANHQARRWLRRSLGMTRGARRRAACLPALSGQAVLPAEALRA